MIFDEASPPPVKPRRRWLFVLGVLVLLLAVAALGLLWYAQTDSFHRYVHGRVVSALEDATGGRVELSQLNWNLRELTFDANGLTIHGLEAAGEKPYVQAQKITVDATVLSFLGRRVGLHSIVIDAPVIHLIVDPDGHTNQPVPKSARNHGGSPVQPLFDLQLEHAEVRNGILLVNDRPMPLDFTADNVAITMTHAGAFPASASAAIRDDRYETHLAIGRMNVAYKNWRAFDASAVADLNLMANKVEVKSLKLASGKSAVEASGTVDDFNNPVAKLAYTSNIDLQQAAAIMNIRELRRGAVAISGTGEYTTREYATKGHLTLSNGEYRDAVIGIAGVDGGADFTADKNNFVMPHLFAHILGGSVTGNAEIKNWASAPPAPGENARTAMAEQVGDFRLKVEALPVSRALAVTATRKIPLDRLHAVGTARGTVNIAWRGAPSRARADFSIDVTPPANASAGELPVTATLRGSYLTAAQEFNFLQADIAARSVQIKATGTMASRPKLKMLIDVADLRDVSPLTGALGQQQLPAEMAGRGTFNGMLSGKLSSPMIAGHLALSDLTLPLPFHLPAAAAEVMRPITALVPPAAAPAKPRLAHFDSMAGDIQWSADQFTIANGAIQRGKEAIAGSANIVLTKGAFAENNGISANLTVTNFQFVDLEGLAGYSYPFTGLVNGHLQLSGTRDDPRGIGNFAITKATIYGQPVQSARGDLRFIDNEAQVTNLLLTQGKAQITGTAGYNLKTTAFRLALSGANFNLSNFPQLQSNRVAISGTANFEARGSGTRDAPVIDADVHLRDLYMNGERLGNLEAKANTTGGVMKVRAQSDFTSADFEVNGAIGMRGDFPADLALQVKRLDVDPFLRMFLKGRITGHSSLSGNARLAGPLRTPQLLNITADVQQFSAEVENLRIRNDGPLRFSVAEQVLRLDEFKLLGDDTTLSATGTIALTGTQALDVRADGNVNLKLLQSFNPDLHSGGQANFNIHAAGTIRRPSLLGRVAIANGSANNINFPNGVSGVNGTLVFNQDRVQVEKLTATSGGGTLDIGGFLTYGATVAANATISAHDVRLRYPQGMSETINADLRLTGTRDNSSLTGDVVVTRFSMSNQFDLATAIAQSKQPPAPPDPDSLLNNIRLNLKVTSTPDLQVSTSLAKLSGDINLNVRGTATRPVALGRVNITEGQVTFNGTTYQLDRGDISFTNPVRTQAVVDVAATTRVRDYDVTLGFHGPIDKLSTTYRSDPPLPTADIISLLAFGKTREESEMASAAQPSFTESASNAILGQALNAAVSNRVQRLFGVSRVKIAPEIGGAENNPTAKVTIEQQVSKDFTVTYITDLTHSNQQVIQVEYNYSRDLSFVASRDQYGVVAFDVRIRQRKK